MPRASALLLFSCLALSGCSLPTSLHFTASGSVADVLSAASGMLMQGRKAVDTVKETATDLKNRAVQLKHGVEKITEGSSEVKAAVTK